MFSIQPTRATIAAALVMIACLATLAVVDYENAMPAYIHETAKVDKPEKEDVNVLDNLINLKAYCLGAQEAAGYALSESPGKQAAVLDFVAAYGKNRASKGGQLQNIVTEYVTVLAALHSKYGQGVNQYVLDEFDKSVRHEKGGPVHVDGFGRRAIKASAVGLNDVPDIIKRLAIKEGQFDQYKAITAEQAENADAVAATLFMKSKAMGRFKGFLASEIASVTARMKQEFGYVAHVAFDAEEKAYRESYETSRDDFLSHVAAQAPASRVAAEGAAQKSKWVPPTYADMLKIANDKAKEFLAKYEAGVGGDDAKLIKNMVQQVSGVKAFISTGSASDSGSRMTPKITFVGTKATIGGEIRTVPGAGSTFVQHFPTEEEVGQITKILLTAKAGSNKWECSGLKVRSGGVDAPIVHFKATNAKDGAPFWLKSGQQVALEPIEMAGATEYDTKTICRGWRGTSDCESGGKQDPDAQLPCDAEIDSSKSGFCDCGVEGKMARLNCGGASDAFTCTEICQSV